MRRRFLSILVILCFAAMPAFAQIAPFNEAGVAAGGVTVTSGYRGLQPTQIPPLTSLGFIVDPWGTRIELNEGFKDVK